MASIPDFITVYIVLNVADLGGRQSIGEESIRLADL